jgi:hypothetical protein
MRFTPLVLVFSFFLMPLAVEGHQGTVSQAKPAEKAAVHPDFSGQWVLDLQPAPGAKSVPGAMLGQSFTATQNDKVLTLTIEAYGRTIVAAYNLDGSDSKLMSPTSPGQPDEAIISHATWEGDRLVIKTTTMETVDNKPVEMTTRRVMWIDARGVLLLERTGTPPSLVSPSTSAYRRVK